MAHGRRPTLKQLERAIDERLDTPRLALADLAEAFGCSPSSIKRACAPASFSALLKARRVRRAANAIIAGRTVAAAAALTGVSADHLTEIFVEAYGVRPGDFRRVVHHRAIVKIWLDRALPDPSSRLYYRRRRRWLAIEAHLDAMHRQVRPDTEMARWLTRVDKELRRPDYRGRAHRKYGAPARRQIRQAQLQAAHRAAMRRRALRANPFAFDPTAAPHPGPAFGPPPKT